MNSKQVIDIEALLVLAFRDRQIDRWRANKELSSAPQGPARAASPSEIVRRIGELGTMVQGSGPIARPITSVIPDEYADMLAVHDAVLKLEDFYAEFQTESRIRLWTEDAAKAEGGEIRASGESAHKDFTLALPKRKPRALRRLSSLALVISHARKASRPDCFADWQPKRGRRAAVGSLDVQGRSRAGDAGIEAREVALARASYQAWKISLEWLVVELGGKLVGYSATGPIARSEPWLDDVAA